MLGAPPVYTGTYVFLRLGMILLIIDHPPVALLMYSRVSPVVLRVVMNNPPFIVTILREVPIFFIVIIRPGRPDVAFKKIVILDVVGSASI